MTETTSFFTDGEAYERMMGQWSRAAGEIFLDWLALPRGLRWLDVGCGTGAFTELVLERCAPGAINAIDPSADQIAFAKTRTGAARASFGTGDAQSLPFDDRAFDVAAMALVITFVPDPHKAVAEMKRVVKPGGTVATYMWDILGGGFTQQPLRDALATLGHEAPITPGSPNSRMDALQGYFRGAGLGDIATRTIDITVSYSNFDAFWAAETGLPNPAVQAIRKMSGPEVERLKDYLRNNLPSDRKGRIAYPAKANAIRGSVPA